MFQKDILRFGNSYNGRDFNDAKIISMTGFQTNPLSNYADFSLFCYTDTMDTRKDDSVSRIGFFILVDLLINTLKKNNN